MSVELNPDQRRAAECLDRPVLVTAGAGSGKTRMLTQRFVNALVSDITTGWEPAELDQVLAITFTDKAAGEIAERVRLVLHGSGRHEDARNVSDAWISTIHGLCTRLLRRHPFEAGVDPLFSVLDNVEAGHLREVAFEEAVRNLLLSGCVESDLLFRYDSQALFRATVGVTRELAILGRRPGEIEIEAVEDPGRLLLEVQRLFEQGMGTCELPYTGSSSDPQEHSDRCELLLGRCSSLVPAGEEDRELLGELLAVLAEYKPLKRLKGLEEVAAELSAVKDELTGRVASAITAPYAVDLRRLICDFAETYDRQKERAGALDFDDLVARTVRLLDERPDIADRYREQFRAVMVDEFQDTDALQLRLVEHLSDGDLCTVGDERQSIYRFRGADIDVYRTHRQRMVAEGALVTELDINYRSHPELLGFVNGVFGSAEYFGPEMLDLKTPAEEPARRRALDSMFDGRPRAEAIFVDSTDVDRAGARMAEAECVAGRLQELCAAGANPRDMAILLRSYTHAHAYASAFSRHGVPAVIVGGNRFFGLPEIAVMRALNRAIANLEDGVAVGLLLTSDFAPLTSDALAVLRFGSGERNTRSLGTLLREGAEALDEVDRTVAERLVKVLDDARRRVGRLSLAEVLLLAVEEMGWDLRLLSAGNVGRDAFANVLKFARQAEEFEASLGSGPAAFALYLDARERLGDTEAPASLADDESDAVRIMSIHASKGLEFPIVVVPELAWQGGGKGATVRTHRTPSGSLALALRTPADENGEARAGSTWMERFSAEAAEADDAESARVLYVAFTRAQETLIVSGAMGLRPKQPTKAKHHMARLVRVLGIDTPVDGPCDVILPVPDTETSCRVRVVDAMDVASSLASSAPAGTGGTGMRIALPAGEVIADASNAALPERLSYTQLGEFEHCPKRFWVRRVLGVRPVDVVEPGATDPLRFGTALHTALRLVSDACEAPPHERISAIACQARLSDAETDRLEAAIGRYCASGPARRACAGDIVRRETPFSMRVGSRFLLTGAIDLYSRSGDSAFIIDYKSGTTDEATDLEQRYRLQAECYALAVLGDGCTEVTVEFVRPEVATRKGIQSVAFEFSADDAARIESDLVRRYEEIAVSSFDPKPSHECERCDVPAGLCPYRR